MANLAGDDTDISGLQPIGNPVDKQANMDRKVNRAGAPPKPEKQNAAPSAEGDGEARSVADTDATSKGGPAGDIYASLLHNHAAAGNPFAPFDWAKKVEEDAGTAYHATSRVADHLGAFLGGTGAAELPADAVRHVQAVYGAAIDPKAIHSSIQNIWAQDTAQADVAKFILSDAGLMSEQNAEGGATAALGATANPTLPLGATGIGMAGLAGANLASAFAGSDPNEQASAVAWAALTGTILSAGHIPGGARVASQLGQAFQKWPEIAQRLQALAGARQVANRRTAAGESKAAIDYVNYYLKQGGFPGRVSTVVKAAKPEDALDFRVAVTDRGEPILKGGQKKLRQANALKKLGFDTVDDLLTKAEAEGLSGPLVDKLVDHWKALDLGYDLERHNPEDLNLGSPLSSLREIHNAGDPARTGWALRSMEGLSGVLEHIKEGFWGGASDPWRAQVRALAGHNRRGGATDTMYQHWLDTIEPLIGNQGEQISKAVTNDQAAFDALSPEGKLVAQQWRVISNAVMHEMKRTGYSDDFTGGYLPMFQKDNPFATGRRGASGRYASPFTSASKKHKVEAVGMEDGRLVARPQYRNAFEANKEQAARRSNLMATLTNPLAKVPDDLAGFDQVKKIRDLAVKDPEAAATAAREFAHDYYGDFETDFLKSVRQWGARTLKATRTTQVLNNLTESLAKDGRALAVKVGNGDLAQRMQNIEGYQKIDGGKPFENFMFHPDLHGDLEKLVKTPSGLKDVPGLKQLSQAEGKSVGYIMFSPLIHTMNIAGRGAAAALMNPIEMAHYVARGHALTPSDHAIEAMRLRARARSFGFVPDMSGKAYFDQLSGRMDSALGHESDAPEEVQAIQKGMGLRNVPQQLAHAHQAMNDWFWNWYRDFGVMMFHLEEQAALKHGFSEHDAGIYAAERAKTWVGLANPEDHAHPVLHDAMRLAMFAPEWWKSWAKLMMPVYRKTGMSQSHAAYAAWQGAKFVAAAWAVQKMSGNLANYLLTSSTPWAGDGHFQSGNLPGNQDRIEATAPWLDKVPGIGATPAVNPKTGGRRTLENPLARQTFDTEEAAGAETAYKDHRASDLTDGLTKVVVARMAPLLEGAASLANVDLYRSLTSNSLAHVNPNQPAGLSPQNLLYAALMMSPMGSQWAEKMASDATAADASQQVTGPFGAKVPKAMASMVGDTADPVGRLLFTWLTGVNAPYDRAPKTRGTPISDADYQRYQQAKQKYDTSMQSLSAQALGGQIPPSKWLSDYKQAHSLYQQSLGPFATAPQYTGGTDGLVNDWYALEGQATNPTTGEIDYGKLTQLQAQFRREHSDAQWSDLQHELVKNDKKYPMLGIYHKVLDAHRKFQDDFASEHGLDASRFRQELSEYSALYGDRTASARYLQTHREVSMYEAAKKRQWDTSPAGLVYGMFYNSSTVAAYMQAHHLTDQQVLQQEESAA